jgi:hypothetical protein
MGDQRLTVDVHRLSRAARSAERRLRANAAVGRLSYLLPALLGCALAALAFVRLAQPDDEVRRWLAQAFIAAAVALAVAVAVRWFATRSRHAGALALDRHHHTADRVTSALQFAEVPSAERTPLMEVALRDALRAVESPNPRRAVPFEWPRGLLLSLVLVGGLFGVNRLSPIERTVIAVVPSTHQIEPVVLTRDDIALIRESASRFGDTGDPEFDAAVKRFNQVVEDVAQKTLDRTELFRRLAEIEQSLAGGEEADRALEEGLRGIAGKLNKSKLSRPIADALERGKLSEAQRAALELAEKLKREGKPPGEDLERLRKALQEAAKESSGRVERLEAARRAAAGQRQRLLNKKKKSNQARPKTPADKQRPEAERRRLERLDRDLARARQNQEAVSQLDRDLAKAAEELRRELGDSARHLESGAESINRMARQRMTTKEKQELRRQLQELRELLRQGGPGREKHLKRLQQFAKRARGGRSGGSPGKGQPGEGKAGQGGGKPRLTLGPGGRPIPIPGPSASGGGQRPEGQGDAPGGGPHGGQGSGPDMRGKATDLKAATQDVAAAAVDSGQGTASSEVVYGAAESGFSGSRYKKVYTQYRTVAEDVLERDTIPAGYDFYVRRYFQLIRARGAQ